jgi:anti-anti-sigma factor
MDRARERFAVDEQWVDGSVTLTLHGDLDVSASRTLDRILAGLRERGAASITLDLRDLALMDSSGMRSLLMASLAADRDGGKLELIRARPAVQRRFVVADLEQRLPFVTRD